MLPMSTELEKEFPEGEVDKINPLLAPTYLHNL